MTRKMQFFYAMNRVHCPRAPPGAKRKPICTLHAHQYVIEDLRFNLKTSVHMMINGLG